MKIELTEKQAEYVRNSTHRWNFAVGAVRSGKSHLALVYTIPNGLLERRGKKGINFIFGVTQETVERNVLAPMRDIWGEGLVSNINYKGKARLFGEEVYCIGADNKGSTTRIQGTEIKFAYCDEIVAYHQEVFEMLKSRLSLPYSTCHAACNPASPNHYIKKFIDTEGIDLYNQHYTLWDNPFLPREYVESLQREYSGTVYYKRYIEGLWAQAEGLIYPSYEEAIEERWTGKPERLIVSCDYGTQNAFAALKWAYDGTVWHLVDEYRYSGREEGHQKTDYDYIEDMCVFTHDIEGRCEIIVDPSAASFIAALKQCQHRKFKPLPADNAVSDGIRDVASCMKMGMIKIADSCVETIKEFQSYSWDPSSQDDKPIKRDDHMMDALRYFVKTKNIRKKTKRQSSILF